MKMVSLLVLFSWCVVYASDYDDRRPLLEERHLSTSSLAIMSDSETDIENCRPHATARPPKKWSLRKKITLAAMGTTTLVMAGASIWIQMPDNRSVVTAPISPRLIDCSEKEPFTITGTCDPIADTPICYVNHCQSQSSVDTRNAINLAQNLLGTFFGVIATGLYAMYD